MTVPLRLALLTLRVALAWWVALVLLAALASPPLAGLGGLLLFPPLALALGAVAAWRQRTGLGARPDPADLLAVGCRESISLGLPASQALRVARSAVAALHGENGLHLTEASLAGTLSLQGPDVRGLAALQADRLLLRVREDGAERCTLELSIEPRHRWWAGGMWVDGGRCRRQLDALHQAILARVRAAGEAAQAQSREEALRSRLVQAELAALRAQIEPHFLFNTLAHIRAAVGTDPTVGQAMLDALIDFLRAGAQIGAAANVRLADELGRVERYLELMRLRLGDRLGVAIDVDPALLAQPVPTACLLTLVENAVKHGIERRTAPGVISVRCHRIGGLLAIDVDNDGPGLCPAPDGGGTGLANLRERLRLAHGPDATLCVEDRDGGGVCASLRWPAA